MDNQIAEIRKAILQKIDLSKEASDEEIREIIADEVSNRAKHMHLSIHERVDMGQKIFDSLRKLDVIQQLVEDPEITEIMVNGPGHIFYERAGSLHRYSGSFTSEDRLQDIMQQIVARHNRVVNLSSPIVDTRLEDGSRVNMVMTPISVDGSAITIRKFPEHPFTMQQLIEIGALPEEVAIFLECLVKARYSLLVAGGTGSGKTTCLNALSQYIPKDERIITIEDSAELQLQEIENLVRLETRNANQEGVEAITIRDLIRTALRMRPDRIIVGECRGAEAFDMLQAMNTGHDGSLSTIHANSCEDVLSRLEMMVLMAMDIPLAAVRKQIASGVDIIVHLGRMPDRSRKVLEIAEVCDIVDGEIRLNTLYKRTGNQLRQVGEMTNREKLSGL